MGINIGRYEKVRKVISGEGYMIKLGRYEKRRNEVLENRILTI